MVMVNIKEQFNAYVHETIRQTVTLGKEIRFKAGGFDYCCGMGIVEEYHTRHNGNEVDLYRIADEVPSNVSTDLHYTTQIHDSTVRCQEVNTEFADSIYKLFQKRYAQQNVR